ncbi:hypothetical protein PS627_00074 [Pseudomonas fluorescens]|uniref:YodC family protein n=1 Tax=Pseudomonas sp. p106 TaxID=2479854 RepID=UPI000F7B9830|nr:MULTISPECIES: DUF2158 domain-containing protein [Pseudomonas]RRV49568.1 DUF2158 domain-containing protein [Pseudomonas sp. p106]CAG8863138.1 hypothetical protein PS627_00074 [Pseudomonas fluorescens]
MSSFNVGDVVVMRSGGPKMTVADVGDYSGSGLGPQNGVKCQWFEKTKMHEQVFDAGVLKPYAAPSVGFMVGRG